jgi:hypothetical protein
MSHPRAKTIKTLSSEILRGFSGQLDQLAILRLCWATHVAQPMVVHSEPICYEGGVLSVGVDSPAWASRLRQQTASLLRVLRHEPALKGLRDFKIRIQPTKPRLAAAPVPVRLPSRLSPRTARLIQGVAESIADPDLRAALERLAKVASEPSEK